MKKLDHDKAPAPQDASADPKPADYLRSVIAHLKSHEQREAFAVLRQAAVHFPDEPLVMSYYGCLLAVVEKKYRTGVDACKKAILLLKQKEMVEEDILYPVFYLNLGRAYVAAGKKQEALESFYEGLHYDKGNRELKKELRSLGIRKAPPLSFLDRSNPINKYIGMLLHKSRSK